MAKPRPACDATVSSGQVLPEQWLRRGPRRHSRAAGARATTTLHSGRPAPVPVDIEEILDVALGIDLITIPNLWQSFEIDGYITPDGTELYLDDWMYWNRPARARFTIAHELGHLHVHRDVLDAASYTDSDGYRRFLDGLSHDYIELGPRRAP